MARQKRALGAAVRKRMAARKAHKTIKAKKKKKVKAQQKAKRTKEKTAKRKRLAEKKAERKKQIMAARKYAKSAPGLQKAIREVQHKDKAQKHWETSNTLGSYCKAKGKLKQAVRKSPEVSGAISTLCGPGKTYVCAKTTTNMLTNKKSVKRKAYCRALPGKGKKRKLGKRVTSQKVALKALAQGLLKEELSLFKKKKQSKKTPTKKKTKKKKTVSRQSVGAFESKYDEPDPEPEEGFDPTFNPQTKSGAESWLDMMASLEAKYSQPPKQRKKKKKPTTTKKKKPQKKRRIVIDDDDEE